MSAALISPTTTSDVLTSSNTTDGHDANACAWSTINTFFSLGLVLTVGVNMMAAIVLFRVPLVSLHGRSNPIYLCIRFLNICDIMQVNVCIFPFTKIKTGWSKKFQGRSYIKFNNFLISFPQALLLLFMPAFVRPDCSFVGGSTDSIKLGAGPGTLAFFAFFFNLISPITTILMALDRCIALYQPFKYRSHLGLKVSFI